MIPKIIWQTYKDPFNELPQYIRDCLQTWKDLNPEYEYRYMDDNEAKNFILQEFGQDWLDIFNSYPLGVMRGDLWRYMVVYIYGGVYADLDTLCKQPINSWINKNKDMIICVDDDPQYYAQLAFAASPNNPTIKLVLDLIKEASAKTPYANMEYVDKTTGILIWTEAVKHGIKNNHSIYCYDKENSRLFHNGAIKHLGWSTYSPHPNYASWQKEVKLMLGNLNGK
jgi:mannosyltransferase OCH1-like enzyme